MVDWENRVEELHNEADRYKRRAEKADREKADAHEAFLIADQLKRKAEAENASLRTQLAEVQALYDAGVKQWNPVYEIVLNERDALRAQVEAMRTLLSHADRCIDCDGDGKYPSGAQCKSCLGVGLVAKGEGEALPVQSPGGVEDGWVLVPREPTEEMLVGGSEAVRDFYSEGGQYPRTKAMWRAMIAAVRPSPQKNEEGR